MKTLFIAKKGLLTKKKVNIATSSDDEETLQDWKKEKQKEIVEWCKNKKEKVVIYTYFDIFLITY